MDNNSQSAGLKKHWGVLLFAWIAFIATVMWTLALGLVLVKLLVSTDTADVPDTILMLGRVLMYTAPVTVILTSISVILARKYDSSRLVYALTLFCCAGVWILIASCCYGLSFTLNGPAIVIFLVSSFILYVATVAFMIAKRRQTTSGPIQPIPTKMARVSSVVAYMLGGIACLIFISEIVVLVVDKVMEQMPNDHFAVTKVDESAEDTSSPQLIGVITGVCNIGGYKVMYQIDANSGIFECENTAHPGEAYGQAKNPGEIYIVSYGYTDNYGFKHGSYRFLGTTYEKTVDKYFADIPYVYRQCEGSDCLADLVIVTRAHSIEEAIENNVGRVYDYVKDVYSQNPEGDEGTIARYLSKISLEDAKRVKFTVFYDHRLENKLSTKDYFLIGPAVSNLDAMTMPFGTLIGDNNWVSEDDGKILKEFSKDVGASSLRVRNALANNVYTEAKIDDGDSLTLETLRERLISNVSTHPMSNWVVNSIVAE